MADSHDEHGFPKPQDDFGVNNPFMSPVAEEAGGQGFVTRPTETLNPWISMWTKPRKTVRQQLETDPAKYVLLLAAIGGISNNLDQTFKIGPEIDSYIGAFFIAMVAGAIGGILWLFFFGWLVAMTGRSIGGVARAMEVRTALAWSTIPSVWLMPLSAAFTLYVALAGPDALVNGPINNPVDLMSSLSPLVVILAVLGITAGVWQIVLACKSVGEAHEFSGWRGLGSLILAGLVVVGFTLMLVFVIIGLVFAMGGLQ